MNHDIIVEMVFGSHLYGLTTEKSDKDYKGIYLPTIQETLLQSVRPSIHTSTKEGDGKNSEDDIDREHYSLQYFIKLACDGETVALDMLHAPESAWIYFNPIWKDLVAQRHLFYTRNLKAFVSYARKQAAKYGVKGSRLDIAMQSLELLKSFGDKKLGEVWEQLPSDEHRHKWYHSEDGKVIAPEVSSSTEPFLPYYWEVCGKKMSEGAKCSHYLPMLQGFINEYGQRAILAKENKGIDWKAISHAFRAAFQVAHILQDGGYTYPLPESEFILKVKKGELDYQSMVGPALDHIISTVEEMSNASTLPETVDRTYWEAWLVNALLDQYGKGYREDTRESTA